MSGRSIFCGIAATTFCLLVFAGSPPVQATPIIAGSQIARLIADLPRQPASPGVSASGHAATKVITINHQLGGPPADGCGASEPDCFGGGPEDNSQCFVCQTIRNPNGPPQQLCATAPDGEVGTTHCRLTQTQAGTTCAEFGDACSIITITP